MRLCSIAAILVLATGIAAYGNLYTASGTNDDGGAYLEASADFSLSGNTLTVTLTNTSTDDILRPSDVLTAVFFSTGTAPLTQQTAYISPGSTFYNDVIGPGNPVNAATYNNNVGGEWVYWSGLSGAPHGATMGISSVGLAFDGQPNFNGPDLEPPTSVDGLQYGIASAGDDPLTGNTGVMTSPLINNEVVFTLTVPEGFSLTDISNVSFQYGTDLSEPNIIPAPGAVLLGLLGFSAIALIGWVKRRLA